MLDKIGNYKVEFENLSDGSLEVRYFDDHNDSSYRSWRFPKEVVKEIVSWWRKLMEKKNIHFPIKEKTRICEFNMYTEKCIEIREFDSLGRYKMTGWSLPKAVVEKLIKWDVKDK